jgi:hypothetical protein
MKKLHESAKECGSIGLPLNDRRLHSSGGRPWEKSSASFFDDGAIYPERKITCEREESLRLSAYLII